MQQDQPKSQLPMGTVGIVAAVIIIVGVVVASQMGGSEPAPEQAAAPAPQAAAPTESKVAEPEPLPIVFFDKPEAAPQTVFKDAADADQTLANFKGKVLLVNFWATWCAPCVKEMPTLDALQVKLGGADFQVVAIAQDREGARVAKPFHEKQGWTNLAFFAEAPGKFMRDAKLQGLPTTLLIDKAGNEVARVEGEADWGSPEVEKIIRDQIAKP